MKKKFNLKAKMFGLALLAATATAAAPAAIPQVAMAAETTQNTNGMYPIVRNINIYYKNEDGTTTFGGSAPYTGYVSNKNMKFTFPEVKVADLFEGGLGYWKPDRDTIPAVTATYSNPPADENIYLTKNTSTYTEETKRITRSVKYYYVDSNGKKTSAGSYTDSVDFKRPGYIDADGNKIMDDWSGEYTFKEIPVEEKNGYTANMQKVPAKTVTPFDSDFEVEVLYSKIPTRTESKEIVRKINYVYKDSGKTFGTYTQTVTLSRDVYNDASGKLVVLRDWSEGEFPVHNVEAVSGYTADKQSVPAAKCTANTASSEVNVYFTAIPKTKYTVTFTDGQGKTLKTETVEEGQSATAPSTPVRDGYTFAGWDKSFSSIKGDLTVNAKWNKVSYEQTTETKTVTRTITYYLRNEKGVTSKKGQKKQTATFSRTGYIDASGKKVMPDWPEQTWPAVETPTQLGYTPEIAVVPAVTFTPDNAPGDMVIYLDRLPTETQYKTVKRKINFIGKNNDGTTSSLGSATQSVTINRIVYTDTDGKVKVKRDWSTGTMDAYAVPDRTGYTKQQTSVPALNITSSSNDTEVNVYYDEVKAYTVRYHLDDTSAASSKTTKILYGVTTTTLSPSELGFKKNGYTFVGWKSHRGSDDTWYIKNDSTGKKEYRKLTNGMLPAGYSFVIYKSGATTAKISTYGYVDFYGVWAEEGYNVLYHLDDNSAASSKKTWVKYGVSTKTLSNNDLGFKKSGMTFKGWKSYRESDGKWYIKNDTTGAKEYRKLTNGVLPKGYSFVIYKNNAITSKIAKSGNVHFYGVWK